MMWGMRWFGIPLALVFLFGLALCVPGLFWPVLAMAVAAGGGLLALRHTTVFCVGWLLVAGCSLEMTATDLLGPAAFQTTIALVKAAEIGLALLCARRWGARADPGNPAWRSWSWERPGWRTGFIRV